MINFLPRCEQNNYYKPSFQAYEKTFVMLKPDSFKRSLDGKIMESLKAKNLDVLKQWEGIAPREKLEGNYIQHKNKSFFKEWIDFLLSGKVRALLVGGEDAISEINNLKNQFALHTRQAKNVLILYIHLMTPTMLNVKLKTFLILKFSG